MIVDIGRDIPPDSWTQKSFQKFQNLLQSAAELDKSLGLEDCEDPSKQEWMEEIKKLNNLKDSEEK